MITIFVSALMSRCQVSGSRYIICFVFSRSLLGPSLDHVSGEREGRAGEPDERDGVVQLLERGLDPVEDVPDVFLRAQDLQRVRRRRGSGLGFVTMGPTFSSILNWTPIPSSGSMMSAKIIPASTSSALTASTTT